MKRRTYIPGVLDPLLMGDLGDASVGTSDLRRVARGYAHFHLMNIRSRGQGYLSTMVLSSRSRYAIIGTEQGNYVGLRVVRSRK